MIINEDIVREALKSVIDPEIHASIIDLGLIYDVRIEEQGKVVEVDMTLTTPFCPYGPVIVQQTEEAVKDLPGVETPVVNLVWDPPWDPNTMASDEIKDMMNLW